MAMTLSSKSLPAPAAAHCSSWCAKKETSVLSLPLHLHWFFICPHHTLNICLKIGLGLGESGVNLGYHLVLPEIKEVLKDG